MSQKVLFGLFSSACSRRRPLGTVTNSGLAALSQIMVYHPMASPILDPLTHS